MAVLVTDRFTDFNDIVVRNGKGVRAEAVHTQGPEGIRERGRVSQILTIPDVRTAEEATLLANMVLARQPGGLTDEAVVAALTRYRKMMI